MKRKHGASRLLFLSSPLPLFPHRTLLSACVLCVLVCLYLPPRLLRLDVFTTVVVVDVVVVVDSLELELDDAYPEGDVGGGV